MAAVHRPAVPPLSCCLALLVLSSLLLSGCGRRDLVAPAPGATRAAEPFHHEHFRGQSVHMEGSVRSGAIWEIDKPAVWNKALVIYLHGYTNPSDPVALPHNEAIRDSLVARGYAVAASSYSSNGYAAREGVRESDALREIFAERIGKPRRTWLLGQSLGGLIGLLLTQRSEEHYDGTMLVCGIVGTSIEEVQYVGDIRVLFDTVYGEDVLAGDLEHAPRITDPNQEIVTSLITVLGFSMQGGSDLFARTQSQSFFDNATYAYHSDLLPAPLVADINGRVARYTRSPQAEQFLRRFGEPSPRLRIPLLTLHTSRDPVVPAWHEDRLKQVVTSPLLIQRVEPRYGHCPFSAGELMVHFNDLVNFAKAVEHDDDLVAQGEGVGEGSVPATDR